MVKIIGKQKRLHSYNNSAKLPFIIAIILVSIFFLLLYNSYGIFYLSNDDTGIMKTFSGYATGEPTTYHAYGSYTLGLLFKLLYTIAPKLNWYTYCSIFVVIVCNAVIIACIYCNKDRKNGWFQYIDFFVISILTLAISLYGIAYISWTINSVFAAIAGMMLLLVFINKKDNKWAFYILALLFLFISLIIRSASYKAVMPFALLVFAYYVIQKISKPFFRKENLRICGTGLLLMLPIIAIYGYSYLDNFYKQDMFPSNSSSFEYYRGLYTDSYHIPYEGNEEFYESLGWDSEFYNMTRSWFFIDRRFNTDNLKKIAEKSVESREQIVQETNNKIYFDEFINQTKANPVRKLMTVAILGFFFSGVVMFFNSLIKKRHINDCFFLVLAGLLSMVEWAWLIVGRARFIDRVFYCTSFPSVFIGIWVISKHFYLYEKRKAVCIVVGVLSVWCFYIAAKSNISNGRSTSLRESSQISVDADEIAFTHPENLYISDTTIAGGVYLFLNMDLKGCGKNRMLWGGTGVFTKPFYTTIARFGYDEFFSENLFDDNVYYVTTDNDLDNSAFMAYMRKCFGETVGFSVIQTTASGVYVYDLNK